MSEAAPVEISAPAARSGRIALTTLAFYAAGEMPITMTMVLLGLFGLFFYNSVLGLPAPLVSLGFAAGLALDAVLDPYIGYRSDRTRSRMGRRHGFMLAGALTLGPCFLLLFSPPRHLGNAGLFIWLVLSSLVFRAASAVYRIPYLTLGAELSQDYDERTRIIAVRSLFGLIGTGCAAGLSFLLFSEASSAAGDPKLNYAHYPRLGLVFGLAMTACALIAVWGTAAHRHAAGIPLGETPRHSFFSGFRLAMRNRAFRSVWLSFTIFFLAVVLNASLAVHYFTWYAHIHENRYLSLIQVSFVLGAFVGVLMWMALAKRAEKRTLYAAGTLVTAVLLCGATLLIGDGHLLGTGSPLPLILGHAAAGLFASALWVMPASMLADVADQDQLATGLRREGIYFGILNFGEKVASVGSVTLAGLMLHYFVRLAPASATQTSAVTERLGVAYGLVPGFLAAVAAVLILSYPLTRSAVRGIQRQLAGAHMNPTHV
jgi:glycoside/pentoside/hexuronide:cation symporter, GPH family